MAINLGTIIDFFHTKILNAVGLVINPATEDGNLASIKGQTDKLTFDISNNLKVVSLVGGLSQLQVRDSNNVWQDVGYFLGNFNVPIQGTIGDGAANNNTKISALTAIASSVEQAKVSFTQAPLSVDLEGNLRSVGKNDSEIKELLFLILQQLVTLNKHQLNQAI